MNAPSHPDCTDPRCMTCYMYRYRNADTESVVKRALRAKLRKNGSRYVATLRERQKHRPQLHLSLNKLISAISDYLCELGDLQNAEYIESHRLELFIHLRKLAGDLTYGGDVLHTGITNGYSEYHVYFCGKTNVRPLEEVPCTEVWFWGKEYSYLQAGILWVATFAPGVCFFNRKPMIMSEKIPRKLAIDIALHRWLYDLLGEVISKDLDDLKDDHVLAVFPIPLPDNRAVLSVNYVTDVYFEMY